MSYAFVISELNALSESGYTPTQPELNAIIGALELPYAWLLEALIQSVAQVADNNSQPLKADYLYLLERIRVAHAYADNFGI